MPSQDRSWDQERIGFLPATRIPASMMEIFPATWSMDESGPSSIQYDKVQSCPNMVEQKPSRMIISAPRKETTTSGSSSREVILEWEDVIAIVDNGDLHKFYRLPSVLASYLEHLERVAREHGSTRNYILRKVLGWSEADLIGSPAQAITMENCGHEKTCENDEGWFEGQKGDCSVQKTPFPYAVAPDVIHYIVWSKRPLLHPCIIPQHFPPEVRSAAWRTIQTRGLSGSSPHERSTRSASCEDLEQAQIIVALAESSRHLRSFIEATWNEKEYEVAWSANPPSLQSLPTLPHWHCFVRRRGR